MRQGEETPARPVASLWWPLRVYAKTYALFLWTCLWISRHNTLTACCRCGSSGLPLLWACRFEPPKNFSCRLAPIAGCRCPWGAGDKFTSRCKVHCNSRVRLFCSGPCSKFSAISACAGAMHYRCRHHCRPRQAKQWHQAFTKPERMMRGPPPSKTCSSVI